MYLHLTTMVNVLHNYHQQVLNCVCCATLTLPYQCYKKTLRFSGHQLNTSSETVAWPTLAACLFH